MYHTLAQEHNEQRQTGRHEGVVSFRTVSVLLPTATPTNNSERNMKRGNIDHL